MLLADVNVLVYAYRKDAPNQLAYLRWLENLIHSDQAYGMAAPGSGSPLRRSQPACTPLAPGPRHWEIFARLCRTAGAKGNLVSDAYLAALVIESGSEWITADHDYSRFVGLRWRHPLEPMH